MWKIDSIYQITSETKSWSSWWSMLKSSKDCLISQMWAQRKSQPSLDHVDFFQIWSNKLKYSKRQGLVLEKRQLSSSSRQCNVSAWPNRSTRWSFGVRFWEGKGIITFWNLPLRVDKKESCLLMLSLRGQVWIKIHIGCQLICWMEIGKSYRTSLLINWMLPEE